MARDLESEIDTLKAQIDKILGKIDTGTGLEAGLKGKGSERAIELGQKAKAAGNKGAVEYYGAYQNGNRGYLRHQEYLAVERLLEMDLEDVAKVLFAVANRQRLAVLTSILEKPRTANELVELLGFGTTGQAYHHLKALQSADLVTVEDGGCYAFRPHRVHGFLMILAGVHDTLDRQYTSGNLGELAGIPGAPA
jgi:DNA gyrase subunit B